MKSETCKPYSSAFWIFVPNIIKIDLYNSELESLEYFCQISAKLILIIFSYTVSNLVHFFETLYSLTRSSWRNWMISSTFIHESLLWTRGSAIQTTKTTVDSDSSSPLLTFLHCRPMRCIVLVSFAVRDRSSACIRPIHAKIVSLTVVNNCVAWITHWCREFCKPSYSADKKLKQLNPDKFFMASHLRTRPTQCHQIRCHTIFLQPDISEYTPP